MIATDTIGALLAAHGEAPALLAGERTIRFAELAARSARAAGGLAALGIAPGDRVALWLPNGPEWLELYFGLARLGAVAVAVNTRFRAVEVADIVHRSGARALAVQPGFKGIDFAGILAAIDPAALARVETLIAVGEDAMPRPLPGSARRIGHTALLATAPAPDRGAPDAGTAVFTTSGTTRAPKLVLHTQRSIAVHAGQVAAAFGYAEGDAVLAQLLPYCGVFGFCQAMAALAAGRPSVVLPAFEPAAAARAMAGHGVTHVNGTDEMYRRLLEAAPAPRPFPALRRAGFAAFDHEPAEFVAAGAARGIAFSGLYGMSEVQALFAARQPGDPPEDRARAGGKPVAAAAQVRARDPQSGRILPPSEAGELEIRGPSLMHGYLGDRDATEAAFTADGYFRTGDLGYAEAGGGFTFLTRLGDALRLAGFLVNPLEISAHIETHAGVAACQVVGAKTADGEKAVAFVIAKPGGGLTAADIARHCRDGLAGFKSPAAILFLDAFPIAESANGAKVQRAKLRALAAEALRSAPGGSGP